MKKITCAGLKAEMAKGENPFTLVDVRPKDRCEHGHIPGAVCADPVGGILEEVSASVKDKDAVIVLFGEHEEDDPRVEGLCVELEGAGYAQVHMLEGGLMGWMEAGGAIESGEES